MLLIFPGDNSFSYLFSIPFIFAYNYFLGRGAARYLDVELPDGLLYSQEDNLGGTRYIGIRRAFGIKKLMFDFGDGTVRNAGVYNLFTYHSA